MQLKTKYHREELLNTLSHGLGILLGLLGFVIMWENHKTSVPWATLSLVIYSISVILLFTASTVYHAVDDPRIKRKLRILDHISIYILIAGTYTPVALITLSDSQGIPLFFVVWGVAIAGTLFKIFYIGKLEWLSLMLYLVMGWLIVFDFGFLWSQLSTDGIFLLFLGGAFYTLGTVFYAIRKIPYNHFIWHLFVLGGAVSHWFLIYIDVL
ncbi:MAG: hemolysin III family protein [Flavobacteriaceae bacterium]|nr:hemolysin III family protein [Muriicola sp.]MBT8289642.1 hemolysin III family protein [Muriicola sp.]NNK21614.1 hemolysin III family protein [Flavobacteriaceae bacterium]NNK34833.1 hemolysin III family protein [Eudoraea sp.]NNL39127.1 hemolysin III family protein [Flavobacteriaceae bacterium]